MQPPDVGPDLPPAGRSLFDHLVTSRAAATARYDVPFPFPALLALIETQLEPSRLDTSFLQGVLIPLGRSLQRQAAMPDFYRHPRVVVAVTTEPPWKPGTPGMLLKNRLYVAYQERAQGLEVVSYNEAAGRFEFQVVRDYAPGKTPRVLYARRALCVSCHQNQGPIFALRPWSESNANPAVAARLQALGTHYHGVSTSQPGEVALAIDVATDEAALFPVYQTLWRAGCGVPDDSRAQRCRAAIFQSALQYRLAMRRGIDTESDAYRDDFVPVQRLQWQRRWPDGLAMLDADIPDRDPLRWHSDIPAHLDPLTARFPNASWAGVTGAELRRVIAGLAEFFTLDDIRRLDAFLFEHGHNADVARRRLDAECAVHREPGGDPPRRYSLRCGVHEPAGAGLALRGWFSVRGSAIVDGLVDRLQIDHGVEFHKVAVAGGEVTTDEDLVTARLLLADVDTGLHLRLKPGTAIEHLKLSWRAAAPPYPDSEGRRETRVSPGHIALTTMDDAAHLRAAIATLLRRSTAGELDVFTDKPFRRRALLRELFRTLGIAPLTWCCSSHLPMPPPETTSIPTSTRGDARVRADDALALFHRHCGTCHGTTSRHPPGFLAGSREAVARQLGHCAERIYYRLRMWDLTGDARSIAPMPPLHTLEITGFTVSQWRTSNALAQMTQFAVQLLPPTENLSRSAGDPAALPYSRLRACLRASP